MGDAGGCEDMVVAVEFVVVVVVGLRLLGVGDKLII